MTKPFLDFKGVWIDSANQNIIILMWDEDHWIGVKGTVHYYDEDGDCFDNNTRLVERIREGKGQ